MASGRDVICAYARKSTDWDAAAISVNAAGNGVLLTDISNFVAVPEPLPDESAGFTYVNYIDKGSVSAQPTLRGWLRYTGALWRFIAQCIGSDVASVVGTSSDYDHTMDVQDNISLYGTLAVYDGVQVREAPSFMPTGFTLRGEAGGMWEFEVRGIADDIKVSGQVNTSLSSVTYTTNALRVPFGQRVCRINDQSAAALGTGDVIKPSSIEITFDRNINPDYLGVSAAGDNREWLTSQPEDNGMPKLTVTLGFPKHNEVTYISDMGDETVKKMDLTIQGPATASSNNYTITMYFPALRVVDVTADISGPERIAKQVVLEGLQAQSAPAGMTGITKLMRLVLRDSVSTEYDT